MSLYLIHSIEDLDKFAQTMAEHIPFGSLVFLRGELGVGKTAFCRAFLKALGYVGTVKSPTYTLVESYEVPKGIVHHFDLYRLRSPEELEWLGWRDYLQKNALCLIEWPEKAGETLPMPNVDICFFYHENDQRRIEVR